jgi:hypothetical protein
MNDGPDDSRQLNAPTAGESSLYLGDVTACAWDAGLAAPGAVGAVHGVAPTGITSRGQPVC